MQLNCYICGKYYIYNEKHPWKVCKECLKKVKILNRGQVMTIDKLHNKSFTISDVVNGQLKTRVFYGYTIKEAKKIFKEYISK